MISNEKVVNNKVVEIIEIYNFYFGYLSTRLCLNNQKLGFQNMIISNKILKQQMITTKKVITNKVVQLIKVYKFILVIFSSDKVVVYIVQKSVNPSHSL
jgi:hypothetical protein